MDTASPRMAFVLVLACGLVGPGCVSLGPKALQKDHGCYNDSVRRVYEEQLLQNIVRLRYNEAPALLDITSIAAQYELSAQAEARPFFSTEATGNLFRSFTTILPDALVAGANRPTISLNPADDGSTTRQLLTSIPLDTMLLLIEANFPVSSILRLWVERLNGVPNGILNYGPTTETPPDFVRFQRIAQLFQKAQHDELFSVVPEERITEVSDPLSAGMTPSAAVDAAKNGLEYRQSQDGKSWVLVRREKKLVLKVNPNAAGSPEVAELCELLNLAPGRDRYDLRLTGVELPDPQRYRGPPLSELKVNTRSTVQALAFLSHGVEVPIAHRNAELVRSIVDAEGQVFDEREITKGLFEVHCCKGHHPPATAYVAIKYRGYWFYLDDRDHVSKATFALMYQLSRLDFARQRPAAQGPLLTLPVGR